MLFCRHLHLQISAVRLPREPSNPERLKGFGYAEFDDVDSLLRALSLNEEVREYIKNLVLYIYLFLLTSETELRYVGVSCRCRIVKSWVNYRARLIKKF